MVTPQAKREAVAYLQTAHEVSERRACKALGSLRALRHAPSSKTGGRITITFARTARLTI